MSPELLVAQALKLQLELAPLFIASLLLDLHCDWSVEGKFFSYSQAAVMSGEIIDCYIRVWSYTTGNVKNSEPITANPTNL